ncbi:CwfJ C-terminus 1-domain-containing protein-like protein [Powellomyces hirtus]|nr:CwfJ C-terminus 1-domain-containing protein-like protein [Powellomyces hirtus]
MGKHKDHKEKKEKKDKHRKKHKKDKDGDRKQRKKDKKSSPTSGSDSDDSAQWVEKAFVEDFPNQVAVTAPPPGPLSESTPQTARDDWMIAPSDGFDFTGTRGPAAERKRDRDVKRDEEEQRKAAIRATRELNPHFVEGRHVPPTVTNEIDTKAPGRRYEFGDGGANWRMMKLKRILEAAEEEGRDIEEVAMERYGSLESFEEAQAERAFLDERRSGGRKDEFGRDVPYQPTVRKTAAFQKPSERITQKRPQDEQYSDCSPKRARTERSPIKASLASKLPVIGTLTPSTRPASGSDDDDGPVLTKNALNVLNSKVLKAKLMGLPDAAKLEAEFERQKRRAERNQPADTIVLSGIDSRGRLLDVGSATDSSTPVSQGPTRRQKSKVEANTHDDQGNRLRYSAEDDKLGLNELILQEKSAGVHDFDSHTADQIARDATYVDTHDYKDENTDRLSKVRTQSEDQKRKIAIGDYKKHEAAVSKCSFCYHEGNKPRVPIIALGTKSYLALPEVIDMVPGHSLIVPIDHVLTTLECDDQTWDEIRNFQKCLLRMFGEMKQGVLFIEQVINFRWHKHTVIECIPIPMDHWEDAPAYFKEAIMASDDEWTQHRKLIDTSKNGFRGSLVKNLPYFHIWFDPSRGYGHVIEDQESWREWFGREVIASVLDLSPDKWRKPRRINPRDNAPRMKWFLERWKDHDWTAMLDGGDY